jgi:hypothetical protein
MADAAGIVGHIIEHGADALLLDPAIRVAAGIAGDRVAELVGPERFATLKKLAEKLEAKLRGKRIEPPPLSVSIPILEAARDESREELQDLWASLLASAFDPSRRGAYRKEFIDVIRQFEPHDAKVLRLLSEHRDMTPSKREVIASRLEVSQDRIAVSFRLLEKLGLTFTIQNGNERIYPDLTAFGREFLMAVRV